MDKLTANMSNIMESVTVLECPEIAEIKQQMLDFGAACSVMSGSGPTVFGIFKSIAAAKKACDSFSERYTDVFLTHTLN